MAFHLGRRFALPQATLRKAFGLFSNDTATPCRLFSYSVAATRMRYGYKLD